MAEDKSGPEAETPFVRGVAAGMKEKNTTGSTENAIEPADKPEDEATSSHNSIAIAPSPFRPGDYVQWESQGVLRMSVAERLSHFSEDGNFAFIEGSTTGIPAGELIVADVLPQSAGESEIALGAAATEPGINHTTEGADDVAPDSDELPPDSYILSTIEQANGITRLPGNSVAEYVKDKQFSQTRVDQLVDKYKIGLDHHIMDYQWRCEVVYELHKETAKSGCKGLFSATLRRIQLADSTAYDMIERHKIRIGEMKDPDAADPRDEEEGEESKEIEDGKATAANESQISKIKPPRIPRVVLTLADDIKEAIANIRRFDQYPDDKTAIKECVLHVGRESITSSAMNPDPKKWTKWAESVDDAREYCLKLLAMLPEEQKKANPLFLAFANSKPSAPVRDLVRTIFRYTARNGPPEEQESTAEIIVEAAKDELDLIREELNRKAPPPPSTSEPVPSEPALSDGPLSEPTPAPTKPRRRLMLDLDDDGLPKSSVDHEQVLGEASDESEAA
jgi:hypothetical protein